MIGYRNITQLSIGKIHAIREPEEEIEEETKEDAIEDGEKMLFVNLEEKA